MYSSQVLDETVKSLNLPDDDTPMNHEVELESGPGSKTEARIPLAHRAPAQVRHHEAIRSDISSPSRDTSVGPRVPEPSSPTVSYKHDEVDENMRQSVASFCATAVNGPESEPINS